jgi:NitT/TauT family transport system permease protein
VKSATRYLDEDLPSRQPETPARLLRAAQGPLLSVAVIAALIVCWETGVRLFHVPEFILPAPSTIWRDTSQLGFGIVTHISATVLTIVGGYLIALVISLPLAIALSSSRLLSHALYPLLVIKQSVPVVALAPILIVILGAGEAPRIAITVLIALFPMVVSTATGLRATPIELVELSRAMGASWSKQLIDIRLPSAVPYIFSGAKISMTLAVVGAVVGEFVAAERGLGYLIYTSTAYFHVSIAFGAMIVLSAIGLMLFQTVVWIERLAFPWAIPEEPDVA